MGRPETIHAKSPAIIAAVRRGMTLKDAANGAGIHYQTLNRWVKRGEAEEIRLLESTRARPRKKEAPYIAFYRQYTEAKAQGELLLANVVFRSASGGGKVLETKTVTVTDEKGNVLKSERTTINKTLNPDWRAAAFALERRYGWSTKNQSLNIDLDFSQLTDEELVRIDQGEDPANVVMDRFRKQ